MHCVHVAAAGYVEQFDTLLPELTVREMLLYTAELKCEMSEPLSKKRARVDQLLELLALQGCSGTLIGDTLARGISGGQVRDLGSLAQIPSCHVAFLRGRRCRESVALILRVRGFSGAAPKFVCSIALPFWSAFNGARFQLNRLARPQTLFYYRPCFWIVFNTYAMKGALSPY